MLIDFHSHFLPKIDDGSRSTAETTAILDLMAGAGVEKIVATPHFYCTDQSVESFVEHRNAAYEHIKPALKEEYPKIYLGAEVLYDDALVNYEKLHDLCIGDTDYLLLEMPYTQLTPRIIGGVREITQRGDVKIVIAHIERYLNFTSMKELLELMNLDVAGQINAKSLMKFSTRRQCVKLVKAGYVQVIGSDYHRIDRGDILISDGIKVLEDKVDKNAGRMFYANSRAILDNKPLSYVLG